MPFFPLLNIHMDCRKVTWCSIALTRKVTWHSIAFTSKVTWYSIALTSKRHDTALHLQVKWHDIALHSQVKWHDVALHSQAKDMVLHCTHKRTTCYCIHTEKTWCSIIDTDDCQCYKHTFIKPWWLWLLQHTFVKHFWLSILQHSCVKSMTTVHSTTPEGEKLMTTFHILQLSVSNYGRLSILQYSFAKLAKPRWLTTLLLFNADCCRLYNTPSCVK